MGWNKKMLALTALVVLMSAATVMAQRGSRRERPLAPRPDFSEEEQSVFFTDARQKLGPGGPPVAGSQPAESETPMPAAETPVVSAGVWSELIEPEVIEDEVKSLVPAIRASVSSPNAFKSGGYRDARDNYSLLAVLFGVIAQYDDESRVRWQDEAAGMRELLARTGFNCKAASDGTFLEAQMRADDLAMLLRGERPDLNEAATVPEGGWPDVADRPPLMKRMEAAQRGRLDQWTANSAEFSRNSADILHEAQLLLLLCEIIKDESYEYADDDLYREYVEGLSAVCRELLAATREERFDDAQSAVSRINRQCDDCHSDFRG